MINMLQALWSDPDPYGSFIVSIYVFFIFIVLSPFRLHYFSDIFSSDFILNTESDILLSDAFFFRIFCLSSMILSP